MTYQHDLLSTALELAKGGYYVFPLTVSLDDREGRVGKKRLHIPFANVDGWKSASTRDPKIIKDWFPKSLRPGMKGLAIDCGKSGIVAIDLDVSGSKNGLEEWKKLPTQQDTEMMVQTRSGGIHRIYLDPSGLITNSSNAVAPGIDIRGAGGLIITAPTKVFGSDSAYSFTGEIVPLSALSAITASMTEIVITRQETQGPRFDQRSGPYSCDLESGNKIIALRKHRLTQGKDMRAAIFGYAASVAQFEAGKGAVDGAEPDADALFEYLCQDVSSVVEWAALNAEDEQWIHEGITKGLADPWEIVAVKPEPSIETGISLADVTSWEPRHLPGNPGDDQALAAPEVVDGLVGKYLFVSHIGWHEWVGDRWSPDPRVPVEIAVQRMSAKAKADADRYIYSSENNAELLALRAERATLQKDVDKSHTEDDECRHCIRKSEIDKELNIVAAWQNSWKRYRDWWKALANGYNYTQVMRWVVKDPGRIYITADQLDQDANLLNCTNGTVDLRSGKLQPHDPYDFITKTTGVAYDPNASHKLWDLAREAFAPGIEQWLQLKVGEGTFGFPSNDDTMIFNFGNGSNGKSTLTDAIMNCLGDYAVFLHDKAVLGTASDHDAEKMIFRGARWAVLEELPEAQVLRSALIKKLIGTAKITARMMRQDPVTFDVTHNLMINSNHKPQVLENDRGTWRRLISVPWPFTFKFPGEPLDREGDKVADVAVKQGLARDAEVQRAALRWIVDGAINFTEQGGSCGPLPAPVKEDTDKWRQESDTFGTFFDEELMVDDDFAVPSIDLLTVYNDWLEAYGKRKVSDRYIATRIITIDNGQGIESKRLTLNSKTHKRSVRGEHPTGNYTAWLGIRWKDSKDVSEDLTKPF